MGIHREAAATESERHDATSDLEADTGEGKEKGLAIRVAPCTERFQGYVTETGFQGSEYRAQVTCPRSVQSGASERRVKNGLSQVPRGPGGGIPSGIERAKGRVGGVAIFHRRTRAEQKPDELVQDFSVALVGIRSVAAFQNFRNLPDPRRVRPIRVIHVSRYSINRERRVKEGADWPTGATYSIEKRRRIVARHAGISVSLRTKFPQRCADPEVI
jgi:hypothetical protein